MVSVLKNKFFCVALEIRIKMSFKDLIIFPTIIGYGISASVRGHGESVGTFHTPAEAAAFLPKIVDRYRDLMNRIIPCKQSFDKEW